MKRFNKAGYQVIQADNKIMIFQLRFYPRGRGRKEHIVANGKLVKSFPDTGWKALGAAYDEMSLLREADKKKKEGKK